MIHMHNCSQVNVRLALCVRYHTKWNAICIGGSIALWYVYILWYAAMPPYTGLSRLAKQANIYWTFYQLLTWPATYLTLLLCKRLHHPCSHICVFQDLVIG